MDQALPEKTKEDNQHISPWQPGECKCGIPDCAGHEVMEDGKIYFIGHPKGDFWAWPPGEKKED